MGAEQSSPKHARRRTYRSSKRARVEDADEALENALDLLRDNDFTNISHQSFPEIRGPVSWAKVGEFACYRMKRRLAVVRSEDELRDVAGHADALLSRLHTRDSVKGARTTRELRDTIVQIGALMSALTSARAHEGALMSACS